MQIPEGWNDAVRTIIWAQVQLHTHGSPISAAAAAAAASLKHTLGVGLQVHRAASQQLLRLAVPEEYVLGHPALAGHLTPLELFAA